MSALELEDLICKGKLALETKDYQTAIEIFSNAIIEKNSNNPEYWSLLAEALFYQNQLESSLKCWHEAASKNPNNKLIWIRISALYALLNQDDLANFYYLKSEELAIE